MLYKIIVSDRNYKQSFVTEVNDQNAPINIDIVPETHKLFSNDIFEYNAESGNVNIIHSSIRNVDNIAAVLVLTGNKTYGRHPNNNKLLYKCIPDDISLPPFLVPYEIKNMGFSKVFVNQYVTIQFTNWDSKHPVGVLSSVIGPVSEPENFYEYQLFCKGLNISLTKFSK